MGFFDSMGNRDAPKEARRQTKIAWWFVAGFLLALPLAAIIGEGVTVTMGFPSATYQTNPPPDWVRIVSTFFGLIVFALPTIGVVFYGRRAKKLGDTTASGVLIVGLIIGIGIPVLMMVNLILQLLTH